MAAWDRSPCTFGALFPVTESAARKAGVQEEAERYRLYHLFSRDNYRTARGTVLEFCHSSSWLPSCPSMWLAMSLRSHEKQVQPGKCGSSCRVAGDHARADQRHQHTLLPEPSSTHNSCPCKRLVECTYPPSHSSQGPRPIGPFLGDQCAYETGDP